MARAAEVQNPQRVESLRMEKEGVYRNHREFDKDMFRRERFVETAKIRTEQQANHTESSFSDFAGRFASNISRERGIDARFQMNPNGLLDPFETAALRLSQNDIPDDEDISRLKANLDHFIASNPQQREDALILRAALEMRGQRDHSTEFQNADRILTAQYPADPRIDFPQEISPARTEAQLIMAEKYNADFLVERANIRVRLEQAEQERFDRENQAYQQALQAQQAQQQNQQQPIQNQPITQPLPIRQITDLDINQTLGDVRMNEANYYFGRVQSLNGENQRQQANVEARVNQVRRNSVGLERVLYGLQFENNSASIRYFVYRPENFRYLTERFFEGIMPGFVSDPSNVEVWQNFQNDFNQNRKFAEQVAKIYRLSNSAQDIDRRLASNPEEKNAAQKLSPDLKEENVSSNELVDLDQYEYAAVAHEISPDSLLLWKEIASEQVTNDVQDMMDNNRFDLLADKINGKIAEYIRNYPARHNNEEMTPAEVERMMEGLMIITMADGPSRHFLGNNFASEMAGLRNQLFNNGDPVLLDQLAFAMATPMTASLYASFKEMGHIGDNKQEGDYQYEVYQKMARYITLLGYTSKLWKGTDPARVDPNIMAMMNEMGALQNVQERYMKTFNEEDEKFFNLMTSNARKGKFKWRRLLSNPDIKNPVLRILLGGTLQTAIAYPLARYVIRPSMEDRARRKEAEKFLKGNKGKNEASGLQMALAEVMSGQGNGRIYLQAMQEVGRLYPQRNPAYSDKYFFDTVVDYHTQKRKLLQIISTRSANPQQIFEARTTLDNLEHNLDYVVRQNPQFYIGNNIPNPGDIFRNANLLPRFEADRNIANQKFQEVEGKYLENIRNAAGALYAMGVNTPEKIVVFFGNMTPSRLEDAAQIFALFTQDPAAANGLVRAVIADSKTDEATLTQVLVNNTKELGRYMDMMGNVQLELVRRVVNEKENELRKKGILERQQQRAQNLQRFAAGAESTLSSEDKFHKKIGGQLLEKYDIFVISEGIKVTRGLIDFVGRSFTGENALEDFDFVGDLRKKFYKIKQAAKGVDDVKDYVFKTMMGAAKPEKKTLKKDGTIEVEPAEGILEIAAQKALGGVTNIAAELNRLDEIIEGGGELRKKLETLVSLDPNFANLFITLTQNLTGIINSQNPNAGTSLIRANNNNVFEGPFNSLIEYLGGANVNLPDINNRIDRLTTDAGYRVTLKESIDGIVAYIDAQRKLNNLDKVIENSGMDPSFYFADSLRSIDIAYEDLEQLDQIEDYIAALRQGREAAGGSAGAGGYALNILDKWLGLEGDKGRQQFLMNLQASPQNSYYILRWYLARKLPKDLGRAGGYDSKKPLDETIRILKDDIDKNIFKREALNAQNQKVAIEKVEAKLKERQAAYWRGALSLAIGGVGTAATYRTTKAVVDALRKSYIDAPKAKEKVKLPIPVLNKVPFIGENAPEVIYSILVGWIAPWALGHSADTAAAMQNLLLQNGEWVQGAIIQGNNFVTEVWRALNHTLFNNLGGLITAGKDYGNVLSWAIETGIKATGNTVPTGSNVSPTVTPAPTSTPGVIPGQVSGTPIPGAPTATPIPPHKR